MSTLDLKEAEHVMSLKLESWKIVCIFNEASIFEGSWSLGRKLVKVRVLEENLYLQKSFNLRG